MFLETHMAKYIEVLDKFELEVQKDSDISISIMGANIIDNMLKDMLLLVTTEKSCVFKDAFNLEKHKYDAERFFDRINKLSNLKLLSKRNVELLHSLRRIRNVFGHELTVSNFEDIKTVDKEVYEILYRIQLPKNSYFVELDQMEDAGFYIMDMNPIKTDTSLQDKFILLFNYLFHNLRWTIEYLVIENEKNISYTKQLSKEVNFNFEDYIHTIDGSFNYTQLYNLRTYVVERYIDEHIEKIQKDRDNLFSVIEEKLIKHPKNIRVKKQADILKKQGIEVYERGVKSLEKQRNQLRKSLETYTYYYTSYKKSKEYSVQD